MPALAILLWLANRAGKPLFGGPPRLLGAARYLHARGGAKSKADALPPPSPSAPPFSSKLHVIKRDGRREPVAFDKIIKRLKSLCNGLDARYVDPGLVAQKVVKGMYNGVSAVEEGGAVSGTRGSVWAGMHLSCLRPFHDKRSMLVCFRCCR